MLNLKKFFCFYISIGVLIAIVYVILQSSSINNKDLNNKDDFSFNNNFTCLNRSERTLTQVRLNADDSVNYKKAQCIAGNTKFIQSVNETISNESILTYSSIEESDLGYESNIPTDKQLDDTIASLINLYRKEKDLLNQSQNKKSNNDTQYDHTPTEHQMILQEKLLYCYVKYSILIKGSRFQFDLTNNKDKLVLTKNVHNILFKILNNYLNDKTVIYFTEKVYEKFCSDITNKYKETIKLFNNNLFIFKHIEEFYLLFVELSFYMNECLQFNEIFIKHALNRDLLQYDIRHIDYNIFGRVVFYKPHLYNGLWFDIVELCFYYVQNVFALIYSFDDKILSEIDRKSKDLQLLEDKYSKNVMFSEKLGLNEILKNYDYISMQLQDKIKLVTADRFKPKLNN